MNRGNRRERVFRKNADYALFLARLERFAAVFEVEVLSYCLMPNHFHLFLRTREASLSRFMQSLLTSFTVFVNRRDRSSGHIFQGRFKAQLVEGVGYFDTLSRYIHLNPVRVASAKDLPMEERRRLLAEYRWSSYPALIGLAAMPEWLHAGDILKGFGSDLKAQMAAYRRYVEEGLMREIEDPAAAAQARSVLGSESFLEWVKREFHLRRSGHLEEIPEVRRGRGSFPLDAVVGATATVTGVAAHILRTRRCRNRSARDLLMAAVRRYCRGLFSQSAMARALGLTLGGFLAASDRGERQEGGNGGTGLAEINAVLCANS
jgi:REP element-mobilizing transposase RayT